jgi:predicted membrane-bound spermidine synthase
LSQRAKAIRIAASAAILLFLELALIRFIAAYVHVFGFYVNFVVIAAFLGMGAGMLRRDRANALRAWTGPLLLLLIGTVAALTVAGVNAEANAGEYLWGASAVKPSGFHVPLPVAVVGLFALTSALFVPLGAMLGSAMAELPALRAYGADLAGSLAGIAAFAVMSLAMTPPLTWFTVASAALVALNWKWRRVAIVTAACCAAALYATHWVRRGVDEHWSPYYRITVETTDIPGSYAIKVNGVLHQVMLDFDSTQFPALQSRRDGYERPYRLLRRLDTALVVGAGTGNDVATLLRLGAKHIDAVEIDPLIARIGQAAHPARPYADPRVRLIVNDARAHLRTTTRKYDVITFGTLDSHALLAGASSVRLDNYVYTRESFMAARAALAPGGSVVMYHLSGMHFIAARLYQNLGTVFGALPLVFDDHRGLFNYTFIAGAASAGAPPVPAQSPLLMDVVPATDDWPFPYLADRRIPSHYTGVLAAVMLVGVLLVGVAAGRRELTAPHWPLFLCGAGFVLLETKGITSLSLLFGSTWAVNSAVIAAILTVALAGTILVARGFAPSPARSLIALAALLAASVVIPPSTLAGLAAEARWLAASAYVGLPVLFASVIFSTLYASHANAIGGLAWNIIGAMVGGVLEYGSMLIGLPGLNWLAIALYLGAVGLGATAHRWRTG